MLLMTYTLHKDHVLNADKLVLISLLKGQCLQILKTQMEQGVDDLRELLRL